MLKPFLAHLNRKHYYAANSVESSMSTYALLSDRHKNVVIFMILFVFAFPKLNVGLIL